MNPAKVASVIRMKLRTFLCLIFILASSPLVMVGIVARAEADGTDSKTPWTCNQPDGYGAAMAIWSGGRNIA
jgi:hypothetical protein